MGKKRRERESREEGRRGEEEGKEEKEEEGEGGERKGKKEERKDYVFVGVTGRVNDFSLQLRPYDRTDNLYSGMEYGSENRGASHNSTVVSTGVSMQTGLTGTSGLSESQVQKGQSMRERNRLKGS